LGYTERRREFLLRAAGLLEELGEVSKAFFLSHNLVGQNICLIVILCQAVVMTIGQVVEPSCFTCSHEIESGAVATARQFVAGQVLAAMKAAGKNQVALASAAGLDQGYVSKLLKGQANLTLKKIDAIAAALGFSGSDLLRHPGDPASALESGRADVPASARAQARILELTKELEDRNSCGRF
jgi:transcriptional regulator with XRE-family HTH domain